MRRTVEFLLNSLITQRNKSNSIDSDFFGDGPKWDDLDFITTKSISGKPAPMASRKLLLMAGQRTKFCFSSHFEPPPNFKQINKGKTINNTRLCSLNIQHFKGSNQVVCATFARNELRPNGGQIQIQWRPLELHGSWRPCKTNYCLPAWSWW